MLDCSTTSIHRPLTRLLLVLRASSRRCKNTQTLASSHTRPPISSSGHRHPERPQSNVSLVPCMTVGTSKVSPASHVQSHAHAHVTRRENEHAQQCALLRARAAVRVPAGLPAIRQTDSMYIMFCRTYVRVYRSARNSTRCCWVPVRPLPTTPVCALKRNRPVCWPANRHTSARGQVDLPSRAWGVERTEDCTAWGGGGALQSGACVRTVGPAHATRLSLIATPAQLLRAQDVM